MAERPGRVLFDTNVLLDVLLKRRAFVREAALLWDRVSSGQTEGVISAHAVTTVSYLVARAYDSAQAANDVRTLLDTFAVAPVGSPELQSALTGGFSDYEDAVTHEAARAAGCDAIVTRNGPDFAPSTLKVYTPTELLEVLEGS